MSIIKFRRVLTWTSTQTNITQPSTKSTHIYTRLPTRICIHLFPAEPSSTRCVQSHCCLVSFNQPSKPKGGPLWSSLAQVLSTACSLSSIFHLRYAKFRARKEKENEATEFYSLLQWSHILMFMFLVIQVLCNCNVYYTE